MRISFDKDWRFFLGEEPHCFWNVWMTRAFDDRAWRVLDLPHDWSIELPRDPKSPGGSEGGYFVDGMGWYRKRFVPPETWKNKRIAVAFEGVFRNAEIWVNDMMVYRHPYGYTSFTVDITDRLELGRENLLGVRVNNALPRHSRWYSGSGIYRHVWLYIRDQMHIADNGIYVTTPHVSAGHAVVRIQTSIVNRSGVEKAATVRWTLSGPAYRSICEDRTKVPAGATEVLHRELTVPSPRLWSPDRPELYALSAEVSGGSEASDVEQVPFGIRSIHFSAEHGFLLNGKPEKMRGGCVHHDCGPLGAMSIDRAEERKVESLKAANFNAVRCAHNPPSPALLDACDRLGLLVIDEAFDMWNQRHCSNDHAVYFDDWWQRDLDSMLLRDRNHPSVVMWSIGNEVPERDQPQGVETTRKLAARVREIDPTRPVTCAVQDVERWADMDPTFALLDIAGYNYLDHYYEQDHVRHPKRIIVGTESLPNRALDCWRHVERTTHVVGDFVWTALDYLGEAGLGGFWYKSHESAPGWAEALSCGLPGWPWHQACCGDIDLCGWKRPQSYYRDIIWGDRDSLTIWVHTPLPQGEEWAPLRRWSWPDVQASWTWPGMEGMELEVDVYSGYDEVEILLNHQSMGRKAVTEDDKLIATFHVPYCAGTLEAVGYRRGARIAGHTLATCGPATGLTLSADRNPIRPDRNDLAYVTVEAVDADGHPCPFDDHVVHLSATGSGHIAALGSNDPAHTEAYRGNRHRLYRGRCLAILRPDERGGEIILNVQADGLAAGRLAVQVRQPPYRGADRALGRDGVASLAGEGSFAPHEAGKSDQ